MAAALTQLMFGTQSKERCSRLYVLEPFCYCSEAMPQTSGQDIRTILGEWFQFLDIKSFRWSVHEYYLILRKICYFGEALESIALICILYERLNHNDNLDPLFCKHVFHSLVVMTRSRLLNKSKQETFLWMSSNNRWLHSLTLSCQLQDHPEPLHLMHSQHIY